MSFQPKTDSVVAFQSTPADLQVTASVSGTVDASILGTVPVTQSGTVITSLVSTTPSSVQVGASIMGLTPIHIASGSIAAEFTPPANQSVSGSVGIEGTPTTLQLAGSIMATSATVTPAANQSVSGTVDTAQIGTRITSMVSTIPSSVIVGASVFGHAPVVIIGGSVATATTNSSVQLLNSPNSIGSVTALQGTNPWTVKSSIAGGIFPVSGSVSALVTNYPAVQVVAPNNSSLISFQEAGSILATTAVAPANQSVSGTVNTLPLGTIVTSLVSTIPSSVIVGASIFGLAPVSLGATRPSISGTVVTAPPQGTSVSGTVLIGGTPTTLQLAGSILATSATVTPAANQSVSGTVDAQQIGTRITSVVSSIPSSMLVGASVIGTVPINGIVPLVGATNLGKAEDAVHGSGDVGVMALAVREDSSVVSAADGDYTPLHTNDQGSLKVHEEPSKVAQGNSTASTLGSDAVFTGTGVDVLHYQAVTVQLDSSHDSATDGIDFQGSTDNSNWDDTIKFTYTASEGARRFQFPTNSQYIRMVYTNGGTEQTHFRMQTIVHHTTPLTSIHRVGDVLTTDRSATLTRAVIAGETTAGGGGMVNVKVAPSGTLETTANMGGDWTVSVVGNVGQTGISRTSVISSTPSSMLVGASVFGNVGISGTPNVNTAGSVVAFQGDTPWINTNVGSIITMQQAPSIVGTYAEDAGHTTTNKGVFTLGVRNDAVASFTSANLDYSPQATDAAGRTLVRPFAPEESRIEGDISLTSTSVTTLVAAAGAGIKNYITDAWFANTGSVSTLVTLQDGSASVLGYTLVPAGGGSNLPGLATPIRTGANATFDIVAGSPTSILYGTVKGFKAP